MGAESHHFLKMALRRGELPRSGNLPLLEVSVEDPAGEAFAADADALQDPVAAQLVHDQEVVHHTWGENVLESCLWLFQCLFLRLWDAMRHSNIPRFVWKEFESALRWRGWGGQNLPIDLTDPTVEIIPSDSNTL